MSPSPQLWGKEVQRDRIVLSSHSSGSALIFPNRNSRLGSYGGGGHVREGSLSVLDRQWGEYMPADWVWAKQQAQSEATILMSQTEPTYEKQMPYSTNEGIEPA